MTAGKTPEKESNSKNTTKKSNAHGRQLGFNLIRASWRVPHQTQLPGTVLIYHNSLGPY
jgi:hypothetical protein